MAMEMFLAGWRDRDRGRCAIRRPHHNAPAGIRLRPDRTDSDCARHHSNLSAGPAVRVPEPAAGNRGSRPAAPTPNRRGDTVAGRACPARSQNRSGRRAALQQLPGRPGQRIL